MTSTGEEISVCECNILHGYILDSTLKVCSTLRKRTTIVFRPDGILFPNDNENNNYINVTRLHAEEIELKWNVPVKERNLILSYEKETMKKALAKSAKRDQYKLNVIKMIDRDGVENYSICISKEDTDRTKLQPIPAKREHSIDTSLLRYENLTYDSKFFIKTKIFNNIISGYSKSKKKNIYMCYFPGEEKSGLLIYGNEAGCNGGTFERCGDLPDNLNIEEIIENYEDMPNVFILNSELISYIAKIPIHAEGSVRIYYKEGEPLRISHTFGAFGVTNSYIAKIKNM